tara:strand:- start:451 stop:783 length:333 start_codon:yes stop_codon:yes gene_type:complete
MGSGTMAFNKLPAKRKIYGDEDFHIRPKGGFDDVCYIIARPHDQGLLGGDFLFDVEGEFGMGEHSLKMERRYARKGDYKNCNYVYYKHDLEDMSEEQKKKILRWATDGGI